MSPPILTQNRLSSTQKAQLFTMWNSEFPESIGFEDYEGLEQYMAKLKNQKHYIIQPEEKIEAWLCTLEREEVPWFIIIVKKSAQGKGYGKSLMKRAMKHNDVLRGWIVTHDDYQRNDGSSYPTPVQFYTKLGFDIQPEITLTKGGITSTRIEWRR